MTHTQTKRRKSQRSSRQSKGEHIQKTVKQVARIDRQNEEGKGRSEWLSDHITAFSGSMLYVVLHIIWFTIWLVANVTWLDFDPYPFVFLTMVVSLEAIFLSTFVLISQNRQAKLADQRTQLDLEVNMVAEDELTKLLRMVADIREHLGIAEGQDKELDEMLESTDVERIAEASDREQEKAIKNGGGRRKSK
jgi:uncharacterized membrane protein